MSWFKVDDGIHDHPKTEHLSLAAVGLWTLAGAYCSRHLTDGAISANRVGKLGGDDDLVRELLDAGLWRVEGRSYIFHDWHDYNPPRAEVEQKRAAATERQRKWRQSRTRDASGKYVTNDDEECRRVTDASTNALVTALVTPLPTRPDPTRPVTTKDLCAPTSRRTTDKHTHDPLFDEFWTVYPVRKGKGAARKAWSKATKKVTAEHIIAAAQRFSTDPNRPVDFTCHASVWLNQERWDDDPYQPRLNGTKPNRVHQALALLDPEER